MKLYNLFRVATAIPKVEVGNVEKNVDGIIELWGKAFEEDVEILLFPELCLTGYTCGDLFHQNKLLEEVENGLSRLIDLSLTTYSGMMIIVGLPRVKNGKLINSAALISNGNVQFVGKKYLPGYKEFYEPRWFSSTEEDPKVFKFGGIKFGVELCEDLWSPEPPSVELVRRGAEVVFNLSASNELIGKHDYLVGMLKQHSARHICGYVYCSSGYGESSQDLVYAGNGIILENGKILAKSNRFSMDPQLVIYDLDIESLRNERMVNTSFKQAKDVEPIDLGNSMTSSPDLVMRSWNAYPFRANDARCKEIFEMQSHALAKRLEHTGMKAVIGVSGGSDSTWALLVIMRALKKLGRPTTDCIGVSMPGFATSNRTKGNAWKLMEALGITAKEIDITEICKAELKALGHSEDVQDITFENVQARTRTQILMNLANQEGGLVIGTGDLSELALGWCTYNADHMSMYGVNVSVPKTLIKTLIWWYAVSNPVERNILQDILDTPVSPELTGTGAEGEEAQVTEDKIGPYELHDFFLYNTLRHGYSPEKILYIAQYSELIEKWSIDEIEKWLGVFIKRFFTQQFKRSCLPDGPKIGSISLSPRGDWRMPSDASYKGWMIKN